MWGVNVGRERGTAILMNTGWISVLALCSAAYAADERKPGQDLPPSVRPVIELARSAAPEFFADTVVNLVEAGKIPSIPLQVEILEQAFGAAASAREPVRLMAIPGTPPDTRALYRGKAGELGLDELSLQTRILRAMLTVNRSKAGELFDRIPRPALEARPCEDPLVQDASPYYEIAGALAQSAFPPDEKKHGRHVQFLLIVLDGARSPAELAPFASAIQSVELKPAEWELLLSALAGKLEKIPADYRPFAMSIGDLRTEIEHLAQGAQALKIRTDQLAHGFRTYLVNQLTAPRCTEDFGDAAAAVQWFNSSFHGALPPIGEDESKPSSRKGGVKAEPYFHSDDSKRLGDEILSLRTSVSRSGSEWSNSLADFLHDFDAWNPEGSDLDVFHQRETILRALFQLTLPGEDRDRVMARCVALLQSSGIERQSPAEWLWEVKELQQSANGDAAKLMQAFRSSGDAGLMLLAP